MQFAVNSFFWTQFWQITLLIPLAILIVRYLLPKRPHLCYGILLLVLLKAIFPPVWDAPTGFVWELLPLTAQPSEQVLAESSPSTDGAAIQISQKQTTKENSTLATSSELPPEATLPALHQSAETGPLTISLSILLLGLWLAGVLCLLGYILGKRAQLLRFHKDTEVVPSDQLLELVEIVSAELGLVKIPKVLVTLHPTVPFASGWRQQVVVLPSHVAEQTELQELKLILAHEMTHLRRGDTLVGILQLFVQVIWWFHPFVYWLNREARRVREECCDTDVVRRLKCQPAKYAHCLLNMLELHQKLRPATELVGLSPLEVTKKRMQNIMRTGTAAAPKFRAATSVLMLTMFALLILPASASSFPGPKVILGSLAPRNALVVENSISPQPKQRKQVPLPEKTPPKKKRSSTKPNKKNETKSPEANPKKPLTQVEEHTPPVIQSSNLPLQKEDLQYRWQRGEEFPFDVRLEARYPREIRIHHGQPTFRVDAYAASVPAFTRLAPKFHLHVTPQENVAMPKLPELQTADDDFYSPFPYSRLRPPFGPPGRSAPATNATFGSNKQVDPSEGSLPYLLGQLQDWVFPVLPENADETTVIEYKQELKLAPDSWSTVSPFSDPPRKDLAATITIQTAVQSITEAEIVCSRSWHFTSHEQIGGEAFREIELTGNFRLDRTSSFPISAHYSGKLFERELNRELRVPLEFTIARQVK